MAVIYHGRYVPVEVRREVIARDGLICRSCGIPVHLRVPDAGYSPTDLQFDHVIPWAEGGPTTVGNLIVSCAGCNLSRPKPKFSIRGDNWHPPRGWSVADFLLGRKIDAPLVPLNVRGADLP